MALYPYKVPTAYIILLILYSPDREYEPYSLGEDTSKVID